MAREDRAARETSRVSWRYGRSGEFQEIPGEECHDRQQDPAVPVSDRAAKTPQTRTHLISWMMTELGGSGMGGHNHVGFLFPGLGVLGLVSVLGVHRSR